MVTGEMGVAEKMPEMEALEVKTANQEVKIKYKINTIKKIFFFSSR